MTSPRRYIALCCNGSRYQLEALNREAALLAARELLGSKLARLVEDGEW